MGEAWRRAKASSYRQQEDRAKATFIRPSLERLWRGTLAGRELVCNPRVKKADVPVGARALLLLKDGGGARVVHDAVEIGDLDGSSVSLLAAGLQDAGPAADTLTAVAVKIVRVGALTDEFSVLLCEGDDEDQ